MQLLERCPYCGSNAIETSEPFDTVDEDLSGDVYEGIWMTVAQTMICLACGFQDEAWAVRDTHEDRFLSDN